MWWQTWRNIPCSSQKPLFVYFCDAEEIFHHKIQGLLELFFFSVQYKPAFVKSIWFIVMKRICCYSEINFEHIKGLSFSTAHPKFIIICMYFCGRRSILPPWWRHGKGILEAMNGVCVSVCFLFFPVSHWMLIADTATFFPSGFGSPSLGERSMYVHTRFILFCFVPLIVGG